jgi:probable HAF family extracellular repeat protein
MKRFVAGILFFFLYSTLSIAQKYTVTDLGTLAGGSSAGAAINASGEIAGESTLDGSNRAILYSNGTMTNLGTLGGNGSGASGINASGQVVGNSSVPSGSFHAFLYSNGKMTDLLGAGGAQYSQASAINTSGQVVGQSDASVARAFLYSNGKVTYLRTPAGRGAVAYNINDSGQIVGRYQPAPENQWNAFVYSNGVWTDLGTLGGPGSGASSINASGQVVGFSYMPDLTIHAFLYSNGKMVDLDPTGGFSEAFSINASGQVVGYLSPPQNPAALHAFLYTPGAGLADLNTLIGTGSGWTLVVASGINDKGQITGTGQIYGRTHAFLLTPIEPYKSATTTTLVSSLNPSVYGRAVNWTATVTSSDSITPTGRVRFTWSGYTIGWGTLSSSGVATLTRSNLNADPYPLTAVYAGDANNLGSTSSVLNQRVLPTTSAATITSSLNPSRLGQAVTFTAKIASLTVMPTGPVTFTAGTTVLGMAQLSGGKATFTTSALAVGSAMVTATYYGDSNIAKSSASVIQTVQP